MASEKELETPVLHVVVVGFHHKKGCQVEYSYPPVISGNPVDSHELPEEWKHLPSLALPDGAHNYMKDTVFFHLPGRQPSKKTVYCVSCYRQMDAKDLLNRTADITRSTVQKSVCVISRLPLYGLIKAKLELITHAYFDERDFSKVELLEQTFNNLNASLTESLLAGTQVFLGLSTREAVSRFKHKLLMLFKLILLERRVLFFGSPVEVLGSTVLSVLSLFPGMLEFGLEQAVSGGGQRLVSPTMGVASLDPGDEGTGEEFVEVRYHESPKEERGETNAALSELLPHVHNTPVTCSSSEPPESPTIPRDVMTDLASGAAISTAASVTKAHKETENRQRHTSGGLEVHKTTRNHAHDSVSTATKKSDRPSLSSQSSTGSGETRKSASSDHEGIVVAPNGQSPFSDLTRITQVSAVQTGHTMPNDQDVMDDYAREIETSTSGFETISEGLTELTLVTDKSDPLFGRSDSVEELDSPESISKIDREDCFSWEEDRVKLSLAMDGEDISASDNSTSEGHRTKGQGSAASEELDSTDQHSQSSENNIHSSESSRASTPSKDNPTAQKKDKNKASTPSKHGSPGRKTAALKNKLSTAFSKVGSRAKAKDQDSVELKPIIKGEVSLQQDEFGFPLAIFTKGCVCHPYLSLQFHSILQDVNVRGFVIGATNILFRQQKQVTDVILEVEEGKIEIKDRELQRQLHLTTADLRFSEYLVRVVTEEKSSLYLDGTEWEGSDEWIRAQFRSYLQCLLATMLQEDLKMLEDFGLPFVTAWRTTHNYHHWLDTAPHPKMADIAAGHPFQGNLSVNDVRMKFNHTIQSTERGRKINAAVVQTGKYVLQTGKVVGGAFSSARSAVSSWFTSITNDWRHSDEEDDGSGGGGGGGGGGGEEQKKDDEKEEDKS